MTKQQAAAYVFAQSVAALAAIEGSKAANVERERNGYALAYDEGAFADIAADFGITHNQIMALFAEAAE